MVERLVHWSTALMMLALIVTGAILYFPPLALVVGHRSVVENVHVIIGLSLLGPLVVGIAGPWRRRLVEDLRRFDRWKPADFAWFRRQPSVASRRRHLRDKFNGGQKLEAALLGAAMVAALATGVIMRYAPSSWLSWATGATLVHDTLFFVILFAVAAHIAIALSRPEQLRSMFHGRISRQWAGDHAAGWLAEVDAEEAEGAAAEGGDAARRYQVPPTATTGTRADSWALEGTKAKASPKR
ncbi:MAG TPA: cytochrome b/b6 domain-containing protein [Acidimicrobiales bacterium]|nr:cytochrome b/b6 domain-containing protein [Acidimicrobiales bacterium]